MILLNKNRYEAVQIFIIPCAKTICYWISHTYLKIYIAWLATNLPSLNPPRYDLPDLRQGKSLGVC